MGKLKKAKIKVNGHVFKLSSKGKVTTVEVGGCSFEPFGKSIYPILHDLLSDNRLFLESNDGEDYNYYAVFVGEDYVSIVTQSWGDPVMHTFDTLGEALVMLEDKGVIKNLKRLKTTVKGQ